MKHSTTGEETSPLRWVVFDIVVWGEMSHELLTLLYENKILLEKTMKVTTTYFTIFCLIFALCFTIGCDNKDKQSAENETNENSTEEKKTDTSYINIGTAPSGGVFYQVGAAIAGVVEKNIEGLDWKVTAESTKGSQENIRLLVSDDSKTEFAMANAAISYFAVRGERGWKKEHSIRAVMTLAPNIGLFVTTKASGIKSIADLKGKRVVVGPAGAGFEYFLNPVLEAHGVTYDDFSSLNATYFGAGEMLKNGSANAAFMGGAIPIPAVEDASATLDLFFIPFEPTAIDSLVKEYPFFDKRTVPAEEYEKMLTEPFDSLNVGSMHLITAEQVDEETVYNFTKTVYNNRAEVAKAHKAGKAINEKNVVINVGTPFHPGAIRFYKEIGIWPE